MKKFLLCFLGILLVMGLIGLHTPEGGAVFREIFSMGTTECSQEDTLTAEETTAPPTVTDKKAVESPEGSFMVWIPKTGSKYHSRANCCGMKNPKQVTKSEAQTQGYTPCSNCH